MRDPGDVFHVAVPSQDLDASERFYVGGLGAKLARRYDDRITLDFFGDQVVCHLSEKLDSGEDLYPRHFGVTFRSREDFDNLLKLVELRSLEVFRPLSVRFQGTAEEHFTIVLKDPSRNLLEFKHYLDPRMMY